MVATSRRSRLVASGFCRHLCQRSPPALLALYVDAWRHLLPAIGAQAPRTDRPGKHETVVNFVTASDLGSRNNRSAELGSIKSIPLCDGSFCDTSKDAELNLLSINLPMCQDVDQLTDAQRSCPDTNTTFSTTEARHCETRASRKNYTSKCRICDDHVLYCVRY